MTNSADAIKLLITYLICTVLAIVVGYTLTDPLDYGTFFIFGLIAFLILSPALIKWHYPLMLFGLGAPIYCFFLKGNPPLWQVVSLLSFGIAIVDRTLNKDKKFISPAVMVWPIVFIVSMAFLTAKLTGGIGLRSLGGGADGGVGGGKKYIALFAGAVTFLALTSRGITKKQRNLYIVLYFLPGVLQLIGDLFPYLPSPLNSVNLLIPASSPVTSDIGFSQAISRFSGFGAAAGAVAVFMLAKYGLGGIFRVDRPIRLLFFAGMFALTLVGGFRIVFLTFVTIITIMFFLEGLHRTRMLPLAIGGCIVAMAILVPLAHTLPNSIQRTLTVVPFLKLDNDAVMDAEASKQWRLDIWHDTWPKVPQYLLLGKGYALTAEDYDLMGGGQFVNGAAAGMDKSEVGLAVAGDYHSGPLSTLMPFGIWGAIGIVWLMAAGLFVLYRNYKYSPADLQIINIYLFAAFIWHVLCFFFIFGAFSDDVYNISRVVGFSIALNWGVRSPQPRPVNAYASTPLAKRVRQPQPQPA